MPLGDTASLICSFFLSVAACRIVRADPFLGCRLLRVLLGVKPAINKTNPFRMSEIDFISLSVSSFHSVGSMTPMISRNCLLAFEVATVR